MRLSQTGLRRRACTLLVAGIMAVLPHVVLAQSNAMPSPPATANVSLGGTTIQVTYNKPSLRGRHLGGPEIVPYGQVWRTGANPATTIITSAPLVFGTLAVPPGTHTVYTLPTASSC